MEAQELTSEAVGRLFQERGLRHTRQRELVYRALASTDRHPTAEELHTSVHTQDGELSLATVYNALESFVEAGLVRRVVGGAGGPSRFDAETRDHVHLATADGRVVDLPPDLSRRLLEKLDPAVLREVESRTGVLLSGVSVQVHQR